MLPAYFKCDRVVLIIIAFIQTYAFSNKNKGRFEIARKHFIIAANLGLHESLQELRKLYAKGRALRAYQAAVGATKSEDREKAEKAMLERRNVS